jgi:sugar transferase EpsL
MKRIFDIVLSVILLIIFLPIILLLSIFILLVLGSPIFFRQERPGLNGSIFELIKFRSMSNKLDSFGELPVESDRLNWFGRLLRESSLDELPELWNVIKGDMSIVGPRPLLKEYLPLYSSYEKRRHDVKPGITGWAQINGRNEISWEEKFKKDIWYVDNHNLILDTKIVFLTVKKILLREGVTTKNREIMPTFEGTLNEKK